MISREAVVGFTLWLIAAIGVGSANGGITKTEAPERTQTAVSVASQTVRVVEAYELNVPQKVNKILLEVFVFDQRDEKVSRLQRALGVNVDGHYGKLTRLAHLAALEKAGLETAFVPAVPNPLVGDGGAKYNISSDPTHRCPEFEPLFAQHGLEPVEVFSYIAYRESRCNPNAVNAKWDANGNVIWTLNKNGSIDRGLLQINSCWKTVTKQVCGTGLEGLFDVNCNIKVAKYIMDNSAGGLANWRIWSK